MAQEIVNISGFIEYNGEWENHPDYVIGTYDTGEATFAQLASGDYWSDVLIENPVNAPTDINHFKLMYWNSGSPKGDDQFRHSFYDLDSTSWILFTNYLTIQGIPDTEYIDGQNLTDILVKFDAAEDKQAWINAFALRWEVDVIKGFDGIRIRTRGVELELEYTPSAGGPRGPLGHPFHGPFGGPI